MDPTPLLQAGVVVVGHVEVAHQNPAEGLAQGLVHHLSAPAASTFQPVGGLRQIRLIKSEQLHGLVSGGVGPDLGAVQGHMAQLDQPRLPAQLQHLPEQVGQGCQMVLAEVRDSAEIGGVLAASTRKAMSSCSPRAMRLEEATPVQ